MNCFLRKMLIALPMVLLIGMALVNCSSNKDWRTASRESARIAPDPVVTQEAVLHVYGARAWGWRGWFAIHTWIAAKRTGEPSYTVYDVVGWRGHRGQPVVDELIDAVQKAAENYPWKNTYKVFPGPNSNTFIAWIGKQVPELDLDLPFTAIGSGYVD
ncbi:MAG: DUF3750 domain-containing protein [Desulfuromonadales bacterium]